MREFEGGNSIQLKKYPKALNEVIYVWDVGENIVGAHQVGVIPGCAKRFSLGSIKKRNFSRHSSGLRHSGHISCRFDPKHRDSNLNEIAQQIAIITPDLYNPTHFIDAKTLTHQSAIASRVLEPTVGKR